jgi:hypothetical protein
MNQSLSYEFTQVVPQVVATGIASSLCTIQQRPQTAGQPKVSAAGQVDLNPPEYTDIPGLVNIPCERAVQSNYRPDMQGVVRTPQGFDNVAEWHTWLTGYFPQITKQNQAVVDGIPYQIQAVEPDSQKQTTRLALREWTK